MSAPRHKWRRFEKLVAAVQHAATKGAEVRWNEDIAGRQFDVRVTFKNGPYAFLTLIEARDRRRPLPVSAVDALVTKAGDAKANKAVLVSRSGFQKACYRVAELHGIELYSLRELNQAPDDQLGRISFPVLNYFDFKLQGPQETHVLPEGRNILPFLSKESIFKTHRGDITLEDLVRLHYDQLMQTATADSRTHRIELPRYSVVDLPDIVTGNTLERITVSVDSVEFQYRLLHGRAFTGEVALDPYLLSKQYEYRNEITGEVSRYLPRDLPVGADTEFKEGRFYYDAHSEFRYYCDAVDGELVTMLLLEGYQHGRNLQVEFTMTKSNETSYLEIEDDQEIRRLTAMLATFRRSRS